MNSVPRQKPIDIKIKGTYINLGILIFLIFLLNNNIDNGIKKKT